LDLVCRQKLETIKQLLMHIWVCLMISREFIL
jgi:uncharacterized membrane protein